MKKLYEKSEIGFALFWVGLYVVMMNIAMQLCGGFDNLESKTVPQLLAPVICGLLLAVAATFWILRNDLGKKYGFCRLSGDKGAFLWFIPLVLLSCTNLKNGLDLPAGWTVTVLMAVNMAVAGYVEEIIFRGFLFRAMAKDGLKSAVIVSAVTFGAGHIVNLGNTADTFGVFLQVCYATAIGFLFTVIAYKGGSLWPPVLSHMFVNGSSVFACESGFFSELIGGIFGQSTPSLTEACSALLIILISGGYALWLWKKAPDPVI